MERPWKQEDDGDDPSNMLVRTSGPLLEAIIFAASRPDQALGLQQRLGFSRPADGSSKTILDLYHLRMRFLFRVGFALHKSLTKTTPHHFSAFRHLLAAFSRPIV